MSARSAAIELGAIWRKTMTIVWWSKTRGEESSKAETPRTPPWAAQGSQTGSRFGEQEFVERLGTLRDRHHQSRNSNTRWYSWDDMSLLICRRLTRYHPRRIQKHARASFRRKAWRNWHIR